MKDHVVCCRCSILIKEWADSIPRIGSWILSAEYLLARSPNLTTTELMLLVESSNGDQYDLETLIFETLTPTNGGSWYVRINKPATLDFLEG